MTHKRISIARDYTRTPGPRYKSQGKFSGEAFRDVLIEGLHDASQIIVELDGTAGFGSSFLDEAFGGLVRNALYHGLTKEEILRRISIISADDPSYREEAEDAMRKAEPEKVA